MDHFYSEDIHAPVAQGDVMIKRIDEFPKDLKPALAEAGNYIVAHSETGHHHVLPAAETEVYDQDEFVSYVRVNNVVALKHLRSFDTHAPIGLPPGNYRITRQREYTPEGFRRAAD